MTANKTIATLGIAGTIFTGGLSQGFDQAAQDAAINPYTDTGTRLETRVKGNLVEVDKTAPKITMRKWNGEDSLGVSYSKTRKNGQTSRKFLTKVAQYDVDNKESVVMEPTDDGEGFNIDIKLNAKPTSNVFTYQFENWQDKDFFYQPPLNVEMASSTCTETDCGGSHRPENVVGSYAVYSKTKANHVVGKTNYETGKLFHIFRPLVSDSASSTVWATLDYKDGVLSVTVPQNFLDKAVYPVLVDPTFGYTTAGGTGDYMAPKRCFTEGVTYTGASGTVDSMSIYVKTVASPNSGQLGLYDTSNNFIGSTSSGTMTANSWNTKTFGSPPTISAISYYLAAQTDANWNWQVARDSSTAPYKYYDASTYGTWANPVSWTTAASALKYKFSIYATYTASGGGTPAPSTRVMIIE